MPCRVMWPGTAASRENAENEDASTGEASCYGVEQDSKPLSSSLSINLLQNEAAQILVFNQLAEVGVDVVGVDDEGLA